jgi:peroxiredoxin Q/BCP
VYFAASCDTVETNTKFAESLDLDYPILSDPEKKTAEEYEVVTATRELPFRWTFFIGKDGRILYIEKEVQPREAGEQILARLEQLKVEPAKQKTEK